MEQDVKVNAISVYLRTIRAIYNKAIQEDLDLSDHMNYAMNSLRIVLAADESIKTGKTIEFQWIEKVLEPWTLIDQIDRSRESYRWPQMAECWKLPNCTMLN